MAGCRYRTRVHRPRCRRRFRTPAAPQAEDGGNGVLLLRLPHQLQPQGRVAQAGRHRFRRRRLPRTASTADRTRIPFPFRIPIADGGGNDGEPPAEPMMALQLRAALVTEGLRTRRPLHRRIRHPLRQQPKVHRSSGRKTHTTVRSTADNGGTAGRVNHRIQLPLTHPRIKQATARHRRDHRAPITFSHSAERRWMKS